MVPKFSTCEETAGTYLELIDVFEIVAGARAELTPHDEIAAVKELGAAQGRYAGRAHPGHRRLHLLRGRASPR